MKWETLVNLKIGDIENSINNLQSPAIFASGSVAAGGAIGLTGSAASSSEKIPILGGQLNAGVGASFGIPLKGTYGASYTHILK